MTLFANLKSRVSAGIVLAVLGVASLLSCGQKPTISDNSKVIIQPGLGVSNICEVGMTFGEIRRLTHDATKHEPFAGEWSCRRWRSSKIVLISSLGATASLGQDGNVDMICFHLRPERSGETIRGLDITNPFRGKVTDRLAFGHGKVTRADVELQFGKIDQVLTNLADAIPIEREGKPFSHRQGDGRETVYYRRKGINFDIESNVVVSVWIYGIPETNP